MEQYECRKVNAVVPGTFCIPVDRPDDPFLLGSRCNACGLTVFPKIPVCPGCRLNGTMETAAIGRTARIFSHTIAHYAPEGFVAPYYQAYLDLPEGPRVFSLISDRVPVMAGVLDDGMEMKLVIEPIANTRKMQGLCTYKYCPIGYGR